jgi:peptide methionine sulfoxide reductase MsrA
VGGTKDWPTYQSIGDYTEGVLVTFDKSKLTYSDLVAHFFRGHSPFSNCYGKQYMKGVWYHNEEQQAIVEAKVAEVESGGEKIKSHYGPVGRLYRAEEYHQRYYEKHR